MSHLAAVSVAQGQPLQVQSRSTPKPGPGELLLAVKSVALNPADTLMRGTGLFIPRYPTILGFDVAGVVLEVGDGVPTNPADNEHGVFFAAGVTKVAAYSGAVWAGCDPDYGVFQERCLVPWQHAAPLPAAFSSWHRAATLPVSVQVPLCAWDALGLASAESGAAAAGEKEALLIWGASSSVGTMGVQLARSQKARGSSVGAVYATAGAANHAYVKSLGADRVFDYKSPEVVESVVYAAKEDGLVIRHCFLATGDVALCQAVLSASGRTAANGGGKIASAPVVPDETEEVDGVQVIFLVPSLDKTERLAQFQRWMAQLSGYVAAGVIKPSPEPKIVGTGLESINDGLDTLSQGVSCSKLVIQIAG
ncbi:Alcohol dehydrogenase zinc-containing [Cordyceps militaris]|uniref:Alcohol dehydrogenase zinc-containing n=1 Tax=Cordyceps militaris TaxID=73501 RepID=A0A2H4SRL5_CORMI|nr:Alcohol dehydrogenase zinc-containing [Cordyceps militaris]